MDDAVVQSLIKWPAVPTCCGWLALDRRGVWRMRDDYAQTHRLPGDPIKHAALNAFISRNYACDTEGRYFFQNGPQRVFVDLEATPWVVRMMPTTDANYPWEMKTQCDSILNPSGALLDESGHIYIEGTLIQTVYQSKDTELRSGTEPNFVTTERPSIALLHDHDLELFSSLTTLHESTCSIAGVWHWDGNTLALEPIRMTELAQRFQFQTHPRP